MGNTRHIPAITHGLTTHGLITLALNTLALLTLTGCTGATDPADPTPPPTPRATTSTPSPTPTPTPSSGPATPTPPVMPPAAKAHTKAGAKAFVRYFWQVVDFAGTTLDSRPLVRLTADGCLGCTGAVDFVDDMRRGGATFHGAHTQVSNIHMAELSLGGHQRAELPFDTTTPDQSADYPGTARDEHYPANTSSTRFYLKPVTDGWRVVLWESA